MINSLQAVLQGMVSHSLDASTDGLDLTLSPVMMDISDSALYDALVQYLTGHFREPELFRFSHHSGDISFNPLYLYIQSIFDNPGDLHEYSVRIARHLYEKSRHPNIKPGELHVAYFTDILFEDEIVDAVVIVKSESKDTYLSIDSAKALRCATGINIGKFDKGCIIFNTEKEAGYKICNIDHSNRVNEAKYWREEFLILSAIANDYAQTKDYIKVTKTFVKDRLPKESDTSSIDDAAIMQRSFEYFKNNTSFDTQEYEKQVFQSNSVIESFQDFKEAYQNQRKITLGEQFEISDYALKKHSRVFKSVIKLDKNFHIYIHGDKNKIEKGEDHHGRKYYVLYYENES